MYGLEHEDVAYAMRLPADALEYFNNEDDDEVLRLDEQSISITTRVEGSLSVNVAIGEKCLAIAHYKRSKRARAAKDLDREMANLEKSLPHYREAARIFSAINYAKDSDDAAKDAVKVEDALRQYNIARAATAESAAAAATRG